VPAVCSIARASRPPAVQRRRGEDGPGGSARPARPRWSSSR
jgi:hypothetical protein